MANNKKNNFNLNEIQISDFARSLAHPARIHILMTLAKKNTCICGELVNVLPLAQSTVSQHLKELKKVGLVKGEIEGPRSCYCINWDRFNELSGLFSRMINDIKNIHDNSES